MAQGDVEQSTETEREVLPPDGLQFQAATTTLEAEELLMDNTVNK